MGRTGPSSSKHTTASGILWYRSSTLAALASKSGSGERFQLLVRWMRTPSSRRISLRRSVEMARTTVVRMR